MIGREPAVIRFELWPASRVLSLFRSSIIIDDVAHVSGAILRLFGTRRFRFQAPADPAQVSNKPTVEIWVPQASILRSGIQSTECQAEKFYTGSNRFFLFAPATGIHSVG